MTRRMHVTRPRRSRLRSTDNICRCPACVALQPWRAALARVVNADVARQLETRAAGNEL